MHTDGPKECNSSISHNNRHSGLTVVVTSKEETGPHPTATQHPSTVTTTVPDTTATTATGSTTVSMNFSNTPDHIGLRNSGASTVRESMERSQFSPSNETSRGTPSYGEKFRKLRASEFHPTCSPSPPQSTTQYNTNSLLTPPANTVNIVPGASCVMTQTPTSTAPQPTTAASLREHDTNGTGASTVPTRTDNSNNNNNDSPSNNNNNLCVRALPSRYVTGPCQDHLTRMCQLDYSQKMGELQQRTVQQSPSRLPDRKRDYLSRETLSTSITSGGCIEQQRTGAESFARSTMLSSNQQKYRFEDKYKLLKKPTRAPLLNNNNNTNITTIGDSKKNTDTTTVVAYQSTVSEPQSTASSSKAYHRMAGSPSDTTIDRPQLLLTEPKQQRPVPRLKLGDLRTLQVRQPGNLDKLGNLDTKRNRAQNEPTVHQQSIKTWRGKDGGFEKENIQAVAAATDRKSNIGYQDRKIKQQTAGRSSKGGNNNNNTVLIKMRNLAANEYGNNGNNSNKALTSRQSYTRGQQFLTSSSNFDDDILSLYAAATEDNSSSVATHSCVSKQNTPNYHSNPHSSLIGDASSGKHYNWGGTGSKTARHQPARHPYVEKMKFFTRGNPGTDENSLATVGKSSGVVVEPSFGKQGGRAPPQFDDDMESAASTSAMMYHHENTTTPNSHYIMKLESRESSATSTAAATTTGGRVAPPEERKQQQQQVRNHHHHHNMPGGSPQSSASPSEAPPPQSSASMKKTRKSLFHRKDPIVFELKKSLGTRSMFDMSDFDTVAMIGQGGYAIVRVVRHRATKHVFALKQVAKGDFKDASQLHMLANELDILSSREQLRRLSKYDMPRDTVFSVPNKKWLTELIWKRGNEYFPRFYGCWQDASFVFFLMEYLPGGDLMKHLIDKEIFPEQTAKFYVAQIAFALGYMHTRLKFVHRDVKPDNVLFDKYGHTRLVDFGLSRSIPSVDTTSITRDSAKSSDSRAAAPPPGGGGTSSKSSVFHERFFSAVGTPDYMAPEVHRSGIAHDRCVDWWSLGIIMYEMLFGGPPLSDLQHRPEVTAKIVQNWKSFLTSWPNHPVVSPEAKDLLGRLICDREKRYSTAEEILAHPWFRDLDMSRLRESVPPIQPRIDSDSDVRNFDSFSNSKLQKWEEEKIKLGHDLIRQGKSPWQKKYKDTHHSSNTTSEIPRHLASLLTSRRAHAPPVDQDVCSVTALIHAFPMSHFTTALDTSDEEDTTTTTISDTHGLYDIEACSQYIEAPPTSSNRLVTTNTSSATRANALDHQSRRAGHPSTPTSRLVAAASSNVGSPSNYQMFKFATDTSQPPNDNPFDDSGFHPAITSSPHLGGGGGGNFLSAYPRKLKSPRNRGPVYRPQGMGSSTLGNLEKQFHIQTGGRPTLGGFNNKNFSNIDQLMIPSATSMERLAKSPTSAERHHLHCANTLDNESIRKALQSSSSAVGISTSASCFGITPKVKDGSHTARAAREHDFSSTSSFMRVGDGTPTTVSTSYSLISGLKNAISGIKFWSASSSSGSPPATGAPSQFITPDSARSSGIAPSNNTHHHHDLHHVGLLTATNHQYTNHHREPPLSARALPSNEGTTVYHQPPSQSNQPHPSKVSPKSYLSSGTSPVSSIPFTRGLNFSNTNTINVSSQQRLS